MFHLLPSFRPLQTSSRLGARRSRSTNVQVDTLHQSITETLGYLRLNRALLRRVNAGNSLARATAPLGPAVPRRKRVKETESQSQSSRRSETITRPRSSSLATCSGSTGVCATPASRVSSWDDAGSGGIGRDTGSCRRRTGPRRASERPAARTRTAATVGRRDPGDEGMQAGEGGEGSRPADGRCAFTVGPARRSRGGSRDASCSSTVGPGLAS